MKKIKNVIVSLSLAPLLMTLAGCANTPTAGAAAAIDADTPVVGSSVMLVVHGMSCPLCANNVEVQLLAVPGVQSVNIDMGTGQVKVALDPNARVTKGHLAKAVSDSGFTLAEVRSQ